MAAFCYYGLIFCLTTEYSIFASDIVVRSDTSLQYRPTRCVQTLYLETVFSDVLHCVIPHKIVTTVRIAK